MNPKRSPVRHPRGFTLIEAMVSMIVVTVGMLGLYSGHSLAIKANAKGRKISQATELVQAVAHELALVDFASTALANSNPANDDDVDDRAFAFEASDTPAKLADHQLALSGVSLAAATDLQTLRSFAASDKLDFDGSGLPDFEVYWNVANCTVTSTATPWTIGCSGVSEADAVLKQIGVIVRWREGGTRWFEVTAQSERATSASAGL